MSKEPTCRYGHVCTSSCGNDYDCPCQADHCCALTEDCEGPEHCDEHYYECEACKDTGFIEKTEWADDDKSYEVTGRCLNCNEDND